MKDAMKAWLNRWRRRLWQALFYRMVFGERTAQGTPLPHTRIAPSTCIEGEEGLQLADHVFIGHFNFLDAAGGLRIDEGCRVYACHAEPGLQPTWRMVHISSASTASSPSTVARAANL